MFPLSDDVKARTRPVVTLLLIAASTAVFLYEILLPKQALQSFVFSYGLVPSHLFSLRIFNDWVLLTPVVSYMFIHGGWLHLLGNMWFLWVFGDNVEDMLGKRNFLVFYLTCGLAGAFSQSLVALMLGEGNLPLIGASGAIAGVLGAYFVFFPYARIRTLLIVFFWPFLLELPAIFFLGYWFLLQAFESLLGLGSVKGQGVAWFAHIGGFLCGYFWAKKVKQRRRQRPVRYWRIN